MESKNAQPFERRSLVVLPLLMWTLPEWRLLGAVFEVVHIALLVHKGHYTGGI